MTKNQNETSAVCDANLCFNGAKCDPFGNKCLCKGHYIGNLLKGPRRSQVRCSISV